MIYFFNKSNIDSGYRVISYFIEQRQNDYVIANVIDLVLGQLVQPAGCLLDYVVVAACVDYYVTDKLQLQLIRVDYLQDYISEIAKHVDEQQIFGQNDMNNLVSSFLAL